MREGIRKHEATELLRENRGLGREGKMSRRGVGAVGEGRIVKNRERRFRGGDAGAETPTIGESSAT